MSRKIQLWLTRMRLWTDRCILINLATSKGPALDVIFEQAVRKLDRKLGLAQKYNEAVRFDLLEIEREYPELRAETTDLLEAQREIREELKDWEEWLEKNVEEDD